MKNQLNTVTLICVDCFNYGGAVAAIKKTLEQVTPARTVFLTDIPIEVDGIDVIPIPSVKSKQEYSKFMFYELTKYFDTEHCLVIQHDGYVLDGDRWDEAFLEYDYVGAPWLYEHNRNIGNGGFSLRSKKLCDILASDKILEVYSPEDQSIGIVYRNYLEDTYNIKFPTEELADTFAFELKTPVQPTFGFHGNFHPPYQPTVIVKRTAALGDVVAVEPVLAYFHENGYRVVLETLPQFYYLFVNHRFPVLHPNQIDQRLLATAQYVNLDYSYESNPKQLHLKSYFEYAGVKDYVLKNPQLSVGFPLTKEYKLFKKYVVIHCDVRAQAQRNIYGIDWGKVAAYLSALGYTVIQLGKGEHPEIPGAIELNCTNENFLCYAVGGADMMIGIDSGIANIAVAFNVPAIICYGSVNPEYIIPDLTNVIPIHNHHKNVCEKPFCWHETIGCEGTKCYIDNANPPCTKFETEQILQAIDKIQK